VPNVNLETCKEKNCSDYRGILAETEQGYACEPWRSSQRWKYRRSPYYYPTDAFESNYCRNPDDSEFLWCNVKSSVNWDERLPCRDPRIVLPPKPQAPDQITCEEANCSDYRGGLAETKEGYTCDSWSDFDKTEFPKGGLVGNFCRNPDNNS
jgi:hypothetical protein